MSNYNTNYFNLPLDTLTNITFFNPSSIDGCSIIIIKADTIRKSTYLCDKCGSIHTHTIKEYKPIFNKYLVFNNNLVILNVNKKRFVCYDCNATFTETIPGIDKCARISNSLKKLIADDFIISKTSKDIAIKNFVSQSTVSRLAIKMEEHIDNVNYNYLPRVMGIDEFKATKDTTNAMACLIVDHDTKKPMDILPSRKTIDLERYFKKFSQQALDNVKVVTMDMYDPYVRIVKKFFKNAAIVFDKFHIVQNFTRALNQTRIASMNLMETNDVKYKQLKRYWKALLSLKIEPSVYRYRMSFFDELTNISDVVHTIKSYDQVLSDSYDFYQLFFYHLNNNDVANAMYIIEQFQDKVSDKLKIAIKTFKKYHSYCIEAYNCAYNNAITESIIQKIKLIKRNAYGYKSFKSFKRRIMHYFETNSLRDSLTRLPSIRNIREYAYLIR